MQDEQRQQPGPAQLADERVLRARAARAGAARRAVSSGAASATARSVWRRGIPLRTVAAAPGDRRAHRERDEAWPEAVAPRWPYAAAAAVGSAMSRGSSVSRAMTRRWICDVPS